MCINCSAFMVEVVVVWIACGGATYGDVDGVGVGGDGQGGEGGCEGGNVLLPLLQLIILYQGEDGELR